MSDLPNQPQNTLPQQPQPSGALSTPVSIPGHTGKETELMPTSESHGLTEIKTDVEVEPSLEKYMQPQRESIDLPIDLKQMGMSASGPAQPVIAVPPPAPAINLPLSDDAIETGLHQSITSSIRWMAEFCVRQLKKAHYHLKKLAGGQVIREADTSS